MEIVVIYITLSIAPVSRRYDPQFEAEINSVSSPNQRQAQRLGFPLNIQQSFLTTNFI
jgi:hypothetical protein